MTVKTDRAITRKWKLPPLGVPAYATFHCAATPEGKPFTAEQIVDMDIERFNQPSYHIIVELDGTKVLCLQANQLGAHVGLHNHNNLGICYVGGTTPRIGKDGKPVRDAKGDIIYDPKDTRTPAQKAALREIAAELKATYAAIKLRGHRDWPKVAKACPCFDVATQL